MNHSEWRKALLADGWLPEPIYADEYSDTVSARFTRDGYNVSIFCKPDALSDSMSCWGPDDLAITLPDTYDFDAIKTGAELCTSCGKRGKTVRIGFAGRVCPPCRKELAPSIEAPGWTN